LKQIPKIYAVEKGGRTVKGESSLSLFLTLSNKFSNCFWLLQNSRAGSLSLSHLPYGKDIRMENWGKRKKKKKGEPLYMLQSWAARDGQLRKSCVPYDV
jgi:hypothetical protein